jgi:hypothetical protein
MTGVLPRLVPPTRGIYAESNVFSLGFGVWFCYGLVMSGGHVLVCPRCGVFAVWVLGQQPGLRKCTCACHRVVDEAG